MLLDAAISGPDWLGHHPIKSWRISINSNCQTNIKREGNFPSKTMLWAGPIGVMVAVAFKLEEVEAATQADEQW